MRGAVGKPHQQDRENIGADMDISLENETLDIYRKEIEELIQREDKYSALGPDDLETVVRAFEFTLTNGRKNVRSQMLYDLFHQKRDDS